LWIFLRILRGGNCIQNSSNLTRKTNKSWSVSFSRNILEIEVQSYQNSAAEDAVCSKSHAGNVYYYNYFPGSWKWNIRISPFIPHYKQVKNLHSGKFVEFNALKTSWALKFDIKEILSNFKGNYTFIKTQYLTPRFHGVKMNEILWNCERRFFAYW
jgi:hypothetical protein